MHFEENLTATSSRCVICLLLVQQVLSLATDQNGCAFCMYGRRCTLSFCLNAAHASLYVMHVILLVCNLNASSGSRPSFDSARTIPENVFHCVMIMPLKYINITTRTNVVKHKKSYFSNTNRHSYMVFEEFGK